MIIAPIEIYKTWESTEKNIEREREEIRSWAKLSTEEYSDMKQIRGKCKNTPERGDYKELALDIVKINTKEFYKKVQRMCSSIEGFSKIQESIEDVENRLEKDETKMQNIEGTTSRISTERVKILRRVPGEDGSHVYVIGLNERVGLISSKTSDTRYFRPPEVRRLTIMRDGSRTLVYRGGKKEEHTDYIVVRRDKIKNLKYKKEKVEKEIEKNRKKIKKLKRMFTKKVEDEIKNDIEEIRTMMK